MSEAGIAIRPPLDLFREEIVAFLGLAARGRGASLDLHAGAGKRQDGALDAGFVHLAEAVLAKVAQARQHMPIDGRIDVADGGLPVVLEAGTQEVLFERNLADHPFPVRLVGASCTVVRSGCPS